jgi:imidazolonepropionase-like amidohydrolase
MTPALHVRGVLLPGGEPGELWVSGGVISAEPVSGAVTACDGGYVLPGLVDAHCHIGIGAQGPVGLAEAAEQAVTDRDAGTLLIRDCGAPIDTRPLQAREDLPRIIRAGRHIARTRRYIRDFAHEIEPEDLVAYVRREARRGDGWVKLVGDWIDREIGDLGPCWPKEAVRAAIAAAHEEGARVTAHCFAENSLADLVEAGIDCIEHATGLTEETIPLFAERGVAIVPTLVNILTFPDIAAQGESRFPAYADHMRRLYERRYATVAAAYEAGLPVFVGTDAGGTLAHGLAGEEVGELVRAGLPPLAAISAATWGAREWLGRPGIEEGASADFVVYESDPRADVRVLTAPRAVVLRGRVR